MCKQRNRNAFLKVWYTHFKHHKFDCKNSASQSTKSMRIRVGSANLSWFLKRSTFLPRAESWMFSINSQKEVMVECIVLIHRNTFLVNITLSFIQLFLITFINTICWLKTAQQGHTWANPDLIANYLDEWTMY